MLRHKHRIYWRAWVIHRPCQPSRPTNGVNGPRWPALRWPCRLRVGVMTLNRPTWRIVTFLIIALYKYSYLLTYLRGGHFLKTGTTGPFIATQLNSTRRRVELSCVGEVSIVTQLNSTRLNCFALIGCTLQLDQFHCRSSATVELRRWGCL